MANFKDRKDAGKKLAEQLSSYQDKKEVIVLGLPRGGVPVAYEVAKALDAPLDVFLVRKLGVPGQPELAMGAIASGEVKVMNDDVIRRAGVADQQIEKVIKEEQQKLKER